MFSIR